MRLLRWVSSLLCLSFALTIVVIVLQASHQRYEDFYTSDSVRVGQDALGGITVALFVLIGALLACGRRAGPAFVFAMVAMALWLVAFVTLGSN